MTEELKELGLGSGCINPASLVAQFLFLTRHSPTGIVVLFQRAVTQIRGKN
jgi:hypothetical protein